MLSGGHVPLFAQLHVCMIVAVPCLWPSCMAVHGRRACGRDHGRAVSAVAVRHVVAVAVITAALGVRRAWPWCRGFCVAVVWLRHADGC